MHVYQCITTRGSPNIRVKALQNVRVDKISTLWYANPLWLLSIFSVFVQC